MITNRIWATFCNMKFKSFVLGLLVSRYQLWDRNINIILALTSSGSIAAWAVWQKAPLLWGIIIAISQVIMAIKPFFPYNKLVKELNERNLKIDMLNIEVEDFWNQSNRGKLTDDKMQELYIKYNKAYAELLKFPDDLVFSTSKKIESKANLRMKNFFKTFYNIEINPQ